MARLIASLLVAAFSLWTPQFSVFASEEAGAQGIYAERAFPLSGAPDFETLTGHMTMLVTFQPDCPWCKIQFQDLEAFRDEAAPWLQIAAVSFSGNRRDLVNELREARTDIPAYRSSEGLIEALQFAPGTPCIYLFSPEGQLIAFRRGRQTREQLEQMLLELAG